MKPQPPPVGSSVPFNCPGNFTVQCVVTYMQGGGGQNMKAPPGPETVARQVVIQPPSVVDVRGSGVATNYAGSVPGVGAPNSGPNNTPSGQPGA